MVFLKTGEKIFKLFSLVMTVTVYLIYFFLKYSLKIYI